MIDFVGKRRWYFAISLLVIIPGLVAMIYSTLTFGTPLRLSIDFTSGSLLELRFQEAVPPAQVRDVYVDRGYLDTSVQSADDGRTVFIRSKQLDQETKQALVAELEERFGPADELRYESVGPTVGREVTRAASIAVVVGAIAILAFIVIAFRGVPNAFRYGVCAIAAMVHDVLVTTGLFSIMGLVAGWEVDALFLTALLTVIGFSVQDTIVVFDRIRENIPKRRGEPYELVVNRSVLETLHRSLATQLNAMFVLVAILFFGGATMRQFVATLLVGMVSGTYSSIFNAVPLLVVWQTGEAGHLLRRVFRRSVPVTS
ncbi:MAG: protein translocase subunit SecF [Anaerolineae bacterium]|nr:protein translocase subunit SecF [Anaerolineae bacterium]